MKTSLFDYRLPPERIAQVPAEPRDASRLLVLHRATGQIEHRRFHEIGDYLQPADLLIANNSRVIPARLYARKSTGGQAEVFLLQPHPAAEPGIQPNEQFPGEADTTWRCLVRGRNILTGATLSILPQKTPNTAEATSHDFGQSFGQPEVSEVSATVLAEGADGVRVIRFSRPVADFVERIGEIPLPPYIKAYHGDPERYQTVFSRAAGSVAAPTAGLHFTPELLLALRARGIRLETVTLHIGLDTFRPVEVEDPGLHPIHSEWAELSSETAHAINETSLAGGRVVAVGTTAVRTLEWGATGAQQIDPYDTQACAWQRVAAFSGNVDLFIRPGYRFRAVDALVTNFHLPRSTLLMLVSAFAGQPSAAEKDNVSPSIYDQHDKGRRMILAAYEEAIAHGYRFYSFGDAMLIL